MTTRRESPHATAYLDPFHCFSLRPGGQCCSVGRAHLHQHPHRWHQRGLLPHWCRSFADIWQRHRRLEDLGAGHQGLGGKPQPAAGRAWRVGLGPGRLGERRLDRCRRGGLQGAIEEAAGHRRHLPELHPDRRRQGVGYQNPGRPQGQAHFGGGTQVRYRTERAGDFRGGRPQL
ncbi:hypothetical protein D3C84_518050 [compost metagenome]